MAESGQGAGVWAAPQQEASFVYADYRPYSWQASGRAQGLEVDIAELLVQRLGMRAQHRCLPWARAQADIARGEADFFFAARSPERDQFAKVLGPPLLEWQAGVAVRSGPRPAGDSVEPNTLCGQRLGALVGNQWVAGHLPCRVQDRAGSVDVLLRMLMAERFDAVVDDRLVLLDKAAQLELGAAVHVMRLNIPATPMHLYLSRRSPLAALANRIEDALADLVADGSLGRLRR